MNLCTDQMAMLIAAPGQLHSVSHMASDPAAAVLAADAPAYVVNHGLAEEVFLMQPDLVLAGTYTTGATVALLRRLGVRVEEFAPESSFDDVRANLIRMGELLGRSQRAAGLVAEMDRGLADIAGRGHSGLTVATYEANNYTAGKDTLADAVIQASGMLNLAAELGYAGTAYLPLEMLILAQPDLIAGGERLYSSPAMAEQNFEHPAFKALGERREIVDFPARYTICGAPFTVEAVRLLSEAAQQTKAKHE